MNPKLLYIVVSLIFVPLILLLSKLAIFLEKENLMSLMQKVGDSRALTTVEYIQAKISWLPALTVTAIYIIVLIYLKNKGRLQKNE